MRRQRLLRPLSALKQTAPQLQSLAQLPDRLGERDAGRDADIERAQRRANRDSHPRVGARVHRLGHARQFAPDHQRVARLEAEIPEIDVAPRRQQHSRAPRARRQSSNAAKETCRCDADRVEIIHAGAAEAAVGEHEAGGLDDGGVGAETGAGAQHRPVLAAMSGS